MNATSILRNLRAAEQSLQTNLHRSDLDANARAHMERSMSHLREAFIATNEIGKARSVQQMLADLTKVESLLQNIKRRREIGVLKP